MSSGPPNDVFQTVSSKKVPSTHTLSTPAERILAACHDEIFTVPGIHKLPRNTRNVIQASINLSNSPYCDFGHRRLMPVLDALASLLVSQSRGEVVAVGYIPTDDNQVVLCLGENGSQDKLAAAENHLRQIWGILKALQSTADRTQREETPRDNAVPSDPTIELYCLCYNFSRNRMKRHYDKAVMCNMHNAMTNAVANKKAWDEESKRPLEPPSPTKSCRQFPKAIRPPELMETQWALVDALINVLEHYQQYAFEGGDPIDVLESCSVANDLVRGVKGELAFLDDLLYRYAQAPYNHPDGDKFQRVAEKLLTIDASIRQLLLLRESVTCGFILDREHLDIVRAESHVGHINYDFRNDARIKKLLQEYRKISHEEFIRKLTEFNHIFKHAWALDVHAECAVLAYFIKFRLKAYPYIGVSRLSCVGCYLYFDAYNGLAVLHELPQYYTRGSHSRVYLWVAPPIREALFILEAMERKAEDFFSRLLLRGERPLTLSESSATTFSKSGISVPWEEARARGPLNVLPPN